MASPPDTFPVGLRVLVVDDDPLCLMILERMLRQCSYTVTTSTHAASALSLLRENRDKFDIVISDVYMPDMDGFKLLEHIGLELDLPVIMMSANGETSAVMKGISHGACDYLLKPVRIEELRNIWQHVVRKKSREVFREETSGDWDHEGKSLSPPDDGKGNGQWAPVGGSPSAALPATVGSDRDKETDGGSRKRKKLEGGGGEELLERDASAGWGFPLESLDDGGGLKKARVVWSIELHQQFVNAVNHLGIDKAVPKRIMEIMNVQGLTRENVASHLQKYRLYLKRLSGVEPQPHPVASFQASEGSNFGGHMTIQPGGRGTLSSFGKSASINAGGMGLSPSPFTRGPLGEIDVATLRTLAHLQALQQQQQQQQQQAQAVTLASGGLGGRGVGGMMGAANTNLALAHLGGLSSGDLDMLMQAQQESVAQQRLAMAEGRAAAAAAAAAEHSPGVSPPGAFLGAGALPTIPGGSVRGGNLGSSLGSSALGGQQLRGGGHSGAQQLSALGNDAAADAALGGPFADMAGGDIFLGPQIGGNGGDLASQEQLLNQLFREQMKRPKYESHPRM